MAGAAEPGAAVGRELGHPAQRHRQLVEGQAGQHGGGQGDHALADRLGQDGLELRLETPRASTADRFLGKAVVARFGRGHATKSPTARPTLAPVDASRSFRTGRRTRATRVAEVSYRRSNVLAVVDPALRPGHARRPAGRRRGDRLRRHDVRGARPGDHRRRAGRRRHHRGRRGQGARRRGAGRARHAGQPGSADPAVHHRADRHHRRRCSIPAPPIEEVLPPLLEFLSGAVLVAHNAPYDVGFLKAACAKLGYTWPRPRVLDTAALARRVLIRDEVPNRKLGTLAALLPHSAPADPPGARRRPGHRRRAARADRPAGQPQGEHARRRDRVPQGGHADPARASGTWPRACRTRRGSTSSAPPTAARSTSAPRSTSPPGCAATSPPRRSGPGSPRCSPRPSGSRRSSAPTRWRPRSASCG